MEIKLNGYYGEDFEQKQTIIKDLLMNKKISYDDLDLLMNGVLHKFCITNNKGSYFWTCWS